MITSNQVTFLLATALGTPSHAFTAMLRYVGHTLRASHGQNFQLSLWDVHEVAGDRRNSFHPIWCLLVSQYFLELLSVCHVILVFSIYVHIYTYMFTLFILFFLSELFFTSLKEKHFMSSIGFFWGMCAGLASPLSGLAQHAVWSEPLRDDDEGACSNGIAVCRSAAMKT